MRLNEALILACKKYHYPHQIDKDGHVWMQGGKKKYRKAVPGTCSEAS